MDNQYLDDEKPEVLNLSKDADYRDPEYWGGLDLDTEFGKDINKYGDVENIKLPNLRYKFIYSAHAGKSDFDKVRESIGECEIYVPESFGWTPKIQGLYQMVSNGELTPEEAIKRMNINSFPQAIRAEVKAIYRKIMKRGEDVDMVPFQEAFLAEFNAIYKTRKFILIIDIPAESRLSLEQVLGYSYKLEKDYEASMISMAKSSALIAIKTKKRDDYMLRAMPIVLKRLIKDKGLQDKGEFKILLHLGAFHTKVYQSLKSQGADVERGFSSDPMIMGTSVHEAQREAYFDLDFQEEVLARAILELELLRTYIVELNGFISNPYQAALFLRDFSKNVPVDQIKRIFDEAQGDEKKIADLIRKELPLKSNS